MAKKKDDIAQSNEYQLYLDGQMTPKKRHAFEKRMLEDDFEGEALEGFSDYNPEEIQADLSKLKSRLQKRTKHKSGYVLWRSAAALVLLGVFSFIVYFVIHNNSKTDSLQTRDLQMEEQKEVAQAPQSTISDSTRKEEPPNISYNKKIEEDIDDKASPTTIEPQIEKEQIVEELVELDLEISAEETIADEMISEELEPTDLPTIANEQKEEPLDLPVEKSLSGRVAGVTIRAQSPSKRSAKPALSTPTRIITGRIFSEEDDEALPGVNVTLKGSAAGTITDIDGYYQIEVPEDEDVTLVYSSVGYMQEEVAVNDRSEVNVNIEPDITALSEIVVTGYGTRESEEKPEYLFTPPRPVGGQAVFKNYVKEHMKYPASGLDEEIRGTVKLKFTVTPGGEIKNMEVIKSLATAFDQEAIRLVNEGPAWEPAELNGENVEREVKVKIRFRVPE